MVYKKFSINMLMVTMCIRDRQSAPWLSSAVRDTRRKRRRAERLWRTTKLTIHRDMRNEVSKCVTAAKRLYFTSKIDSAVFSTKQLFKVSNELLIKSDTSILWYQLIFPLMNCHSSFVNSSLTKLRS